MRDVLTDPTQATPDWLTTILRARGVLARGRVEHVQQRQVRASSNVAHLTVRYSPDATASAPAHFVLKMTDPELEGRMPRRNRGEIAFYQELDEVADNLPIVRCFDAVYMAGQLDRFHLLLADPSATTHVALPYSAVPPTLAQSRQIVETLAYVHARFWNDLGLGARLRAAPADELDSRTLSDDFVPWAAATLPSFLDDLGDRLSAERRELYTEIGEKAPARIIERKTSGRHLTLTHGDVHVGNFLYPRDPTADHLYIIDWKGADVAVGAGDLAYMMALYWFPAVRERWEEPLLRHYLHHLLEYGVVGYAWAEFWEDYRLAVLRQFFEAVWGWSARQNSMIWWNHLERITLAIIDLRCIEVL